MKHIFNIDNQFDQSIAEAEKIFNNNGIFIYPTDTIYGIGGNPFNVDVKNRITQLKKRDESKNFIFLIGDIDLVNKYVDSNSETIEKLNKIWPAPVSFILKLNKQFKTQFKQQTAAFRISQNKFCKELLNRIKSPLISTSANQEGEKPLNDYIEIIEKFGNQVDAIFYTEQQKPAISSTVVDLSSGKPELIREGVVNFMDLLKKFS